ncbi:MAG: hypothetical protein ACE361_18135 [Aureliella sp.]
MPNRNSKRKAKQDRHAKLKVAAIPLLLVILGLVLWSNMSATDTPVPVATNPAASPTSPSTSRPTQTARATAVKAEQVRFADIEWPEPVLSFIEDDSPFKDLDYAPEPVVLVNTETPSKIVTENQKSRLDQVAERIKRERVPFSFRSSRRNVVMLGDKLIEVGDEIDENVRVSSISDGSLELAVVAARQDSESTEDTGLEEDSAVN